MRSKREKPVLKQVLVGKAQAATGNKYTLIKVHDEKERGCAKSNGM